jgi:hypothetical protein
MARGTYIHGLAEQFIKGSIKKLPAELKLFAEEFKGLAKMYKTPGNGMVVEDQWAFDRQWQPSDWFAWNTTWLRVKLDLAFRAADDECELILKPIDFKTGKMSSYKNAEYALQLELYALSSFKMLPDIEQVKPALAYLDEGKMYPAEEEPIVFYKKDEAMLQKKWEARVKPMFNDKTFKPTPGKQCDWCMHSRKKGGDCKY